MNQNIINYIKSNPKLISPTLQIYNKLFGRNKIKLKPKNKLLYKTIWLKNTSITVLGRNNTIIIHDLSRLLQCNITILGNNNRIEIGKNAYLDQADFYIEDNNNQIIIGDHSSIHGFTKLATIEGTSITIGQDCMFSRDIHLRTGDSHSIINSDKIRINPSENIEIGDHVWIGTKVICLKGVHISDHSIIGAGSLVTKQFHEPHVILAGNPAKIIKHDIDWLRERI
jgi:acetyltransferase-like isoleucine patch superfamily enzyme